MCHKMDDPANNANSSQAGRTRIHYTYPAMVRYSGKNGEHAFNEYIDRRIFTKVG